jgi:hypothetical protein
MKIRAFWGIFGFMSSMATAALGPGDPSLLACHGDFGRWANKQLAARQSEVDFIVYWGAGKITTDTGEEGKLLALTPLYLDFDVPYADYVARYRVNRIDGTVSQASNFGGVFWGNCEIGPVPTRF